MNFLQKILLFIIVYTSVQSGYAQEYGSDKLWMNELINNESRTFTKKYNFNSTHTSNYDIKFHRLEFNIDPNIFHISGEITTYFIPSINLGNIKFDFTDILSVDEVLYNGNALPFTQNRDILTCTFDSQLAVGKLDSIKVIYSGIPATGINSISKSSHNAIPIISTLSEPYGAKDWWPCKQDLIDKIDSIEVIIKTPKAYRAVSNGLLIGEPIEGEYRITTWRHKYPIPAYLIAIAVTNYVDFTLEYTNIEGNILPILNHVYPEDLVSAKISLETTKSALELFENLFEIYPYSKEKYGHAQFPWGGGMEHATVSFMGSFPEDLISHELAHQWFGDKITCGSWGDIWLNEGFATYLTGLTYEGYKGNFNGWLEGKISHITSSTGGSVYVTDTTSVGSIFSSRLSYSKGAMVLHMLRWKMGDDNFFTAIINYLKDDEIKYAYAKTDDLKRNCENVYGDDLTKFFDQWIYKEGYPSYAVEWKQNTNYSINLLIAQSQSHSSVSFFEMPVEIVIKGVDGEKSIIILDVNTNNYSKLVSVDFEVSSIEFDPNNWLISKGNTVILNPDLERSEYDFEKWVTIVSDNKIQLHTTNTSSKLLKINLYNTLGKIVVSDQQKGTSDFTLNTGSISKGVYYLTLEDGNRIISKKILK